MIVQKAGKCLVCGAPRAPRSKYCRVHKAEARQRWKERVRQSYEEREERNRRFAAAYKEGLKIAAAAGQAATPTPMVVAQHKDPFDDSSPIVEAWHVPEGPCGFAWVRVRPGTCSFAKWLVKEGHARKAYEGGVMIWCSAFGQSIQRKEAWAEALAKHLRETLGVKAYAGSRLD